MTTSTDKHRWLDLAGAPAIPGLRARAFGDGADWERLSGLMIATNTVDAVPWLPPPQTVEAELGAAEGVTPAEDIVMVELDGGIVAACGVDRVVRDGVPTYDVWGNVAPAFRRRGLGAWLIGRNLERVRERAAREDPGVEVAIGSFAEETEAGHRALLAAHGFVEVRHFFLMRRTGLESVEELALPDGLEIRPVTADQHRAIFAAEDEAFRDHWGHRSKTESDFRSTFERAELDTGLWIVAWDGDEIAGVVQSWVWPEENTRLGVRRGWLEHISVRRPWRRRGLARAITAAALVKLRAAGLDEAMLGVDTENAHGALGLYENLGFVVHSRAEAYRRGLDDRPAAS